MNEKGMKDLSLKDREYLNEILAKEAGALTPSERAQLVARRAYLRKDSLERYEIKGAEETGEEVNVDSYENMTVKDLQAMCAERGIEVEAKAKKADLIATLEADDRGELEDEAEDEE